MEIRCHGGICREASTVHPTGEDLSFLLAHVVAQHGFLKQHIIILVIKCVFPTGLDGVNVAGSVEQWLTDCRINVST